MAVCNDLLHVALACSQSASSLTAVVRAFLVLSFTDFCCRLAASVKPLLYRSRHCWGPSCAAVGCASLPDKILATQSLAQLSSSHALSHGVACRLSKWGFMSLKLRAAALGGSLPDRCKAPTSLVSLFMSLKAPVGEETTTLQAGKPCGIRRRTSH